MYNERAVRDLATHERILVVDDEEYIRDLVCRMLGAAGYRCKAVASGPAALGLLDSGECFELMLSDLRMAEMDGVVLLELTKERFPDMPVIMVTAVNDVSEALSTIRNGAYDYLLKPFERDQLLNTVKRALENRRLKQLERNYQLELRRTVDAQTAQLRQINADLHRVNDELKRSHDMMLEALGDALDMRDAETEGHSRRVTMFTIAIARSIKEHFRHAVPGATNLDDDAIRVIARGAFLHDIGKMAIRDDVLHKPGPLSEEERTVMREHCQRGYEMVRKIPFLIDAAEIVWSHQEWWDGSGYPRGLKGEEIPLGARIFAVADTLDAITSTRPYRPARSYQAAREEIERYSGRQFDPAIVGVFLSMRENIWDNVRHRVEVFRLPEVPELASARTN